MSRRGARPGFTPSPRCGRTSGDDVSGVGHVRTDEKSEAVGPFREYRIAEVPVYVIKTENPAA